jgi:hypothetical protein
MRTFLICVSIIYTSFAAAQRTCLSSQYIQQQQLSDPALKARMEKVETLIRNAQESEIASGAAGSVVTEMVYRIPVVVHILYNKASQNISEAQVKSQIAALNRDFRRKNTDTANTPARFKHLAADAKIEFFLATADPSGRATNGIVRKATGVVEFEMNDHIKSNAHGGSNAWDTRYYLNIWVGPLYRLLGYSSLPGSDHDVDGVVVNTSAFGTIGIGGPYNLGRTATHEVGHWLGLRHIWGDTYCGDDLVFDTPSQGGFTTGCPTGIRSSCNSGPNGDMYMNFMDFTDDACTNLFSNGQKLRMRSMFTSGGPRALLLSSKGLNEPWNHTPAPVEEKPFVHADLVVFPNPAHEEIRLNFFHDSTWVGKEVRILNANGVMVRKAVIVENLQKISLAGLKAGLYVILASNEEQLLQSKLIKL